MTVFLGAGTRDRVLRIAVLRGMPEYVIFLKEDKIIFLAMQRVLICGLLERVYTKELFVLSLVELDHQGVHDGIDNHTVGLQYKFLNNGVLTLQWSLQLVSFICNIGR